MAIPQHKVVAACDILEFLVDDVLGCWHGVGWRSSWSPMRWRENPVDDNEVASSTGRLEPNHARKVPALRVWVDASESVERTTPQSSRKDRPAIRTVVRAAAAWQAAVAQFIVVVAIPGNDDKRNVPFLKFQPGVLAIELRSSREPVP